MRLIDQSVGGIIRRFDDISSLRFFHIITLTLIKKSRDLKKRHFISKFGIEEVYAI